MEGEERMQVDSLRPVSNVSEKGPKPPAQEGEVSPAFALPAASNERTVASGDGLNLGNMVTLEPSTQGQEIGNTTVGAALQQEGRAGEVQGSGFEVKEAAPRSNEEAVDGTVTQGHSEEGGAKGSSAERQLAGEGQPVGGAGEANEGFDGGDGEQEQRTEVPLSERKKRKRLEVFVGGLDKEATEEDLRAVFGVVGEVAEVRLLKDPETRRNKGFAFIRYTTTSAAARAAAELEFVQVRGKKVGVLPSEENDTLFLGNINKSWAKEDVLVTLSNYEICGVEEVTLMEDPQHDGMNRGFAFVEFTAHKDALDAWRKLQTPDATFGLDRSAKVAWAQPLNEPDKDVMAQVKSVFVDGMPPMWNEERVHQHFARFGEIDRIVLAKNMQSAKRKDFGFVNFAKRESALAAIEALNNTEVFEDGFKMRMKITLAKPQAKGRPIKGGVRGGHPVWGAEPGRASKGAYESKDRWAAPARGGARYDLLQPPARNGRGGQWDGGDKGGEVEEDKASISSLLRVLREQAEKELTNQGPVEKKVKAGVEGVQGVGKTAVMKGEVESGAAPEGGVGQAAEGPSAVEGAVKVEVKKEAESLVQSESQVGSVEASVPASAKVEATTPSKAASEKVPTDKFECNMCGFGSDVEEEYKRHVETKVHKLIENLRKDEKLANKTPLSILHEFASRNKAEVTYQTRGDTSLGPFELVVRISGVTGVPDVESVGTGRQKTKAKQTAAANALETLMQVVPESEFTKPGQSRLKADRRVADSKAGRGGAWADGRENRGDSRGPDWKGGREGYGYGERRDQRAVGGGYRGSQQAGDDRAREGPGPDWRGGRGGYPGGGSREEERGGYGSRYGAGGLKYGGLKYALPREREETYAERLERIQGRGYAMRMAAAAAAGAPAVPSLSGLSAVPLQLYQDRGYTAGGLPPPYQDPRQLAGAPPPAYQEQGHLLGGGGLPPAHQDRGQLAGVPPPAYPDRPLQPLPVYQDRAQLAGGPPRPAAYQDRGQLGGMKRPYGPGADEGALYGDLRGGPRPKFEGLPTVPPPVAGDTLYGQKPDLSRPPYGPGYEGAPAGLPLIPSGPPVPPPSSAPGYGAPPIPSPVEGGYAGAPIPPPGPGTRVPPLPSEGQLYTGAPPAGPYPVVPPQTSYGPGPVAPPQDQAPMGYGPGAFGGPGPVPRPPGYF